MKPTLTYTHALFLLHPFGNLFGTENLILFAMVSILFGILFISHSWLPCELQCSGKEAGKIITNYICFVWVVGGWVERSRRCCNMSIVRARRRREREMKSNGLELFRLRMTHPTHACTVLWLPPGVVDLLLLAPTTASVPACVDYIESSSSSQSLCPYCCSCCNSGKLSRAGNIIIGVSILGQWLGSVVITTPPVLDNVLPYCSLSLSNPCSIFSVLRNVLCLPHSSPC